MTDISDPIPTDLNPGYCPKCGNPKIEFWSVVMRDHLVWKCFEPECGYLWKTPLFEEDEDDDDPR